MSNNNPFGENSRQRSKDDIYSFGNQLNEQKYTSPSTYSNYQNQTSYTKFQPYQIKYQQNPRPGDNDNKQRNKAMYYSSMNFSNNNDVGSAMNLNSFGRIVNEDSLKNQGLKLQNFNNNDKGGFYNKYAGGTTKDTKNGLLTQTSNNSTDQFNRFPSFNIPKNTKILQPKSSTQSINGESNTSQSAKQKRQRQIVTIKKQLDELNKKMLNKPVPTIGNLGLTPLQNRPARHGGISQSVIFDSNSTSSFSQDLNRPQKQYKTDFSIDQLYKDKNPTNTSNKSSLKTQTTYNKNTNNEQKISTYDTYSSNTYQKTKSYQPISKQFQTQKSPKYSTSTNQKFQNTNKTTNINNEQTFDINKYKNNYVFTEDKGNKKNLYSYQKPNNITNNYSNYNTTNNTNDTYQKSTPSYDKTSYNFSTKTDYSVQQTGFKKKKNYEATIQLQTKTNQVLKNFTTVDKISESNKQPSIDSNNKTPFSQIKVPRSNSYAIDDPASQKQQVKKFKISDFIIGKKMGKGQFGQVLLVKHKITGWVCGLKVMQKKDIRDLDYVQQIARQLAIQFYLAHRNIAQLYGYFEDQTKFYLLIQFCTGGQLLQKLRGQKRMNQKDVSRIIRQVCQGIDYIHKQLIIHRDLKPQNILFNFGTVKISDFGWAVYRGFGLRKTVSGSPLYYPPQIVKGQSYDDKIDIWNIGMMTYECLLGKIPFRVYSELDLGRIVSDQITFPSYVDVSNQAKDFILKTMKKKGQQRLQIRQMLRHPFLAKSQQTPISQQILDQFRKVLG